jgi:UDP-glucuronate decarboxylase
MDSPTQVTGPVNLGNPSEFTMLELAERVLQLTKSTSKLAFKPLPPDDPRQRQPDIGLAQQTLGWKPTISLEDGLKETISYFRTALTR